MSLMYTYLNNLALNNLQWFDLVGIYDISNAINPIQIKSYMFDNYV